MTQWPKVLPTLTEDQIRIKDDFMKHWHEVLPKRYSFIERFNHSYPLHQSFKYIKKPENSFIKTLEIGAGLGEHLIYEDLSSQDYYCLELRENMSQKISEKFPQVHVITGDCQKTLPFEKEFFSRIIAVHVLEHLPDLPSALKECHRVLAKGGVFSVVIPCDPGLVYGLARSVSAKYIFEKRYQQSYDWFISTEHINTPSEILYEIDPLFDIVSRRFFPFFFPVTSLNLCIGLTLVKK